MKIKYLGPSKSVNVAPYGSHFKDEAKDYPDDFGEELLATSQKQQFEEVDAETDLNDMTVAQLKAELRGKTEIPAKAKKDELVDLVKAQRVSFARLGPQPPAKSLKPAESASSEG